VHILSQEMPYTVHIHRNLPPSATPEGLFLSGNLFRLLSQMFPWFSGCSSPFCLVSCHIRYWMIMFTMSDRCGLASVRCTAELTSSYTGRKLCESGDYVKRNLTLETRTMSSTVKLDPWLLDGSGTVKIAKTKRG
jgi:hypothetical protein